MGEASSTKLKLTVNEGSHLMVTDLVHEEANGQSGTTTTDSLDSLDFHWSAVLAQQPVQGRDPLTVEGTLVASLNDVLVANSSSPNSDTTQTSVGLLSLQFNGRVSNTTGESFKFAVAIAGDASGVSFTEGWEPAGELAGGETGEAFVDLSGSLMFNAQLTGIPSVVTLAYNVQRTGLEAAGNTVVVKYPGKSFRFEMAIVNGEPQNPLRITNQDGAVMTLNDNQVNGESSLSGNITVDGVEHATISEEEIGTVLIRFSDNSVRSL